MTPFVPTSERTAAKARPPLRRYSVMAMTLKQAVDRPVDVRPAFAFDCPCCGRENFVAAVAQDFTPQERRAHARDLPDGPQSAKWFTAPEQVVCTSCVAAFQVVSPGELAEEPAAARAPARRRKGAA